MKRKVCIVALVLCLFGAASAWAAGPVGLTGVGVYGSYGVTGGGSGLGLSLKWGSFPVIGLKYNLGSNFSMAVNADYYIIDAEGLAVNFSYFVGAGAYIGITGDKADLGLRLPVGLQFWPVRKFEVFLSPVLTVPLIPSPSVGFGIDLGARVRF